MIFAAALLAGATGFGFGLLSAPLLLAGGFALPFVVTANLALALVTRLSIAYGLRRYIFPPRTAMLIIGSIPGLWLGIQALTTIDRATIKGATGVLAMLMALYLLRSARAAPPRRIPGAWLAAGLAGGFLGATTSLNGIPPALLLARDRVKALSFLADLAVYFVISNAIALALMNARGVLARQALFPIALLWLPGALLGNFLGVRLARRLPESLFRAIALAVIFIAGAVALVTA